MNSDREVNQNVEAWTMRQHPYLERRRSYLLEFFEETLSRDDDEDTNSLCAARVSYLDEALRCYTVDLDDIARKFLVRARLSIDEVFRHGVQPYIGLNPRGGNYADDNELNRHWAIAHRTRYLIDLLLKGEGNADDLQQALRRLNRLWTMTRELSGRLDGARNDVLRKDLWLGTVAGSPEAAISRATKYVRTPITSGTVIKSYLQEHAYVRFCLLVARYKHGELSLRTAVRKSFRHLFDIHWDIENQNNRTCLRGPLYALDWAWLWESVFGNPPNVARAIDLVRGPVELPD